MTEKRIAILVPHTHWDREWYDPFQIFRMRLVQLTDKLLDILERDEQYKSFTFDGQTIVLEDYLEIRPQNRERLVKLIKKERILIGPWYVLPDEYLVSGEALVRNLLIGHKTAREYHRPMKVGYLPDPFGHIAQLPQILDGFGIDSFIFSRGLGEEFTDLNTEFWWEALDGTRVLAVNQTWGYCNMRGWGYKKVDGKEICDLEWAFDTAEWMTEQLEKYIATNYVLFNNGCDHMEPQPELAEMIEYTNAKSQKIEIIHSTYEDFVQRIRDTGIEFKSFRGELHRGKYCALLPGVFSARIYLKQMNERTQTLLERYAEPTSALRWMQDGKYDSDFLYQAWKLLIQNHPHDSICGCSVDEVHQDMIPRYRHAQQIAKRLVDQNLQALAEAADTTSENEKALPVIVFNPSPFRCDQTVKVRLKKPGETYTVAPEWTVKDAEGRALPSQTIQTRVISYHAAKNEWEFEVAWQAKDLPATGWRVYFLEESSWKATASTGDITVDGNTVDNGLVRVTLHPNGSFDIRLNSTGKTYTGLNTFEDTEDAGDEYNWSPAPVTQTIYSTGCPGTVSVVQAGPAFVTLRATTSLTVPETLSEDRMGRSASKVEIPIEVDVTVTAGSNRVEVETRIDNTARDHRLRALFPTGIQAQQHYVETAFAVIERGNDIPETSGWEEQPVGYQAQMRFAGLESEGAGVAFLNQGLPEYEVLGSRSGTYALTLVRAVGWLSRDDLLARPMGAGPAVPTPEAQCLGTNSYRYAVIAYEGNWAERKIWQEAETYTAPALARICEQSPGDLGRETEYFKIVTNKVAFSAVKKAERNDSLIIRVFNPTSDGENARIELKYPVKGAKLVNLDEQPTDGGFVQADGCSVSVKLPPYRIATLEVLL